MEIKKRPLQVKRTKIKVSSGGLFLYLQKHQKIIKLIFLLLFAITLIGCDKTKPEFYNFDNIEENAVNSLKLKLLENPELKFQVYQDILNLKNDSVTKAFLFEATLIYLEKKDSLNFRYWNNQTFSFNTKINDTSGIAEANWDLAAYFYSINILDSAFNYNNKALRLYSSIGDEYNTGKILLNMAIIQKDIRDYIGSEITSIEAIKKLKSFERPRPLYLAYNNLAVVNNELEEYENALRFHAMALNYEKEFQDEILKASSLNNIGVVEMYRGNFIKSKEVFDDALLIPSIENSNPRLYAMLIDNLAFSKLQLGDTVNLLKQFQWALSIRESINHTPGKVESRLNLTKYYLYTQDTVRALSEAQEAENLSLNFNLNGELIESWLLLSELDNSKSTEYLTKVINLSDSLQKEERAIRNKFTRIQYETDEFRAQNEQLNIQKKWMIAGFTGVVLLLISISTIILLKRKNKELKLIQLQQKANEDIYTLMIESQSSIERGQEQEKKRISKELHDGILSQFFGVRLNLELLNDKTDQDSAVKREKYIKELKALETEIRKVSHQLNSDLVSSDVSFINILNDLLRGQEDLGGYSGKIEFEGNIEWEKINPKVKINLFRIIQEALHNINKYAGANNVRIGFKNLIEELILIIEDDGKGFDVENSHDGIGITNMKSRIQDLSGEISILSNKKGTKISIKIPFKK